MLDSRTGPPTAAVAVGGPMDGCVLGDAANAEFEVVLADRSRHRYVRTDLIVPHVSDLGYEFAWKGRL